MATDGCDAILSAVGSHWTTLPALVRATGAPPERILACLERAVASGRIETPRGAYRRTMWRRTAS